MRPFACSHLASSFCPCFPHFLFVFIIILIIHYYFHLHHRQVLAHVLVVRARIAALEGDPTTATALNAQVSYAPKPTNIPLNH
jgi:hypothetical protein